MPIIAAAPIIPAAIKVNALERLDPQESPNLYFGGSGSNGTEQVVQVSLTFTDPAVVLDYSNRLELECDANGLQIKFADHAAYKRAAEQWIGKNVTLLARGLDCSGGSGNRKRQYGPSINWAAWQTSTFPTYPSSSNSITVQGQGQDAYAAADTIEFGLSVDRSKAITFGPPVDSKLFSIGWPVGGVCSKDGRSALVTTPWGYGARLDSFSSSAPDTTILNGGKTVGYIKTLVSKLKLFLASDLRNSPGNSFNLYSLNTCVTSKIEYGITLGQWDGTLQTVLGIDALLPAISKFKGNLFNVTGSPFVVKDLLTVTPFYQMDVDADLNATNVGQMVFTQNTNYNWVTRGGVQANVQTSTFFGNRGSNGSVSNLVPPIVTSGSQLWGDIALQGRIKIPATFGLRFEVLGQSTELIYRTTSDISLTGNRIEIRRGHLQLICYFDALINVCSTVDHLRSQDTNDYALYIILPAD
ncbi:hypothetical protein KVT40_006136 [Elsinoe batatas]|uniref:Uncharacterized protein n=1 Tax=Elsinoe batatas TaxID=2601811 RepID=A0A8K0L1H7_9PEZI|nr:hypothetical protein KVT40_006136 [Elsinoe batatas]